MSRRAEEVKGRLTMWLARRASAKGGLVDRVCRAALGRALALPAEEDFLRDEWVDSDVGFDPDELDRYQRGEQIGPPNAGRQA